MSSLAPTRAQKRIANAITDWYIGSYFGRTSDPGLLPMFMDPNRVGAFAVTADELRRRDGDALFRLLIATAMFQRRQDVQILRILRGIARTDVDDLTLARRLLARVAASPCQWIKTNESLLSTCDLTKHRGQGTCSERPRTQCHMKLHSVQLKRYGHFGKVPTSAALMLAENGVRDLEELRARTFTQREDPLERAILLEQRICATWRVSEKIAAMFLSMLTNPDLSDVAPWSEGIDWTYFVVIDSNVDLFLRSIGYGGTFTYGARRAFMQALARSVDLQTRLPSLQAYNPRVVQQAAYLFMSRTNRRALDSDCSHVPANCGTCPRVVANRCPVRTRA